MALHAVSMLANLAGYLQGISLPSLTRPGPTAPLLAGFFDASTCACACALFCKARV